MKRLVILTALIAVLMAVSALALECSVVAPNLCEGRKIIGMTALSAGGAHASLPTNQNNALVACCEGEITVSYSNDDADIYLMEARDSHVSRVSGENGIKLAADTGLSCGYFTNCGDYDACVFSISSDRDAHISDCGNYAFERKLCCREGSLIGEELEIEEEERANPKTTPPASPAEIMKLSPETKSLAVKKISLPPFVKRFIRGFLKGGLAGNFFRVPL